MNIISTLVSNRLEVCNVGLEADGHSQTELHMSIAYDSGGSR